MSGFKRLLVVVALVLPSTAVVTNVIDTPVTETAVAEAHSYGCVTNGGWHPFYNYKTTYYTNGQQWYALRYWVDVRNGNTHTHWCLLG